MEEIRSFMLKKKKFDGEFCGRLLIPGLSYPIEHTFYFWVEK
jgi:hypothetical protein